MSHVVGGVVVQSVIGGVVVQSKSDSQEAL